MKYFQGFQTGLRFQEMYPFGNIVLNATMFSALGMLFLYWVILIWRRDIASTLSVTVSQFYFVILGIAFMLVETSLMQKFVLLVGHPTLSIAVTL